jgi:membrane protein YdbS with pleckstrin-like domain
MFIIGAVMVNIAYMTFPEVQNNPMASNILVVVASAYFLLIIPFISVAFIDYYYDLHVVTDRRLVDVDQHSLFMREINELALEEVQDVTSKTRGILQSVFDFGHVAIETSSAKEKFEFDNVRHPREIASIVLDLSDQAKRRIEGGNAAPIIPSGNTKADIEDMLYKQIEPLVNIGAITPEDLRQMKAHAEDNSSDTKSEHTILLGSQPRDHEEEEIPPDHNTTPVKEAGQDLDIIIDDPSQTKNSRK